MKQSLEQDPQVQEVDELRNVIVRHQYTQEEGICMGAAALWIKNALRGNYREEVHTGDNLRKAKIIATDYCHRIDPYDEDLGHLVRHMGIRGSRDVDTIKKKILRSHMNYYRRTLGVRELRGVTGPESARVEGESPYYQGHIMHLGALVPPTAAEKLQKVGEVAGFFVTPVPLGTTYCYTVCRYLTNIPGIYLILAETHYMAASSMANNYFFLDNENGLYECTTAAKLLWTIEELRTKWKRGADAFGLGGEDIGGEWAAGKAWYCARCTL